MSLITKDDCLSVTDLYHTVRHKGRVVELFTNLLNNFLDYCLINISDQLVVGIVFLVLIEKLQKHSFALQHHH